MTGARWLTAFVTVSVLVVGCGRSQTTYEWETTLLAADRAFDHRDYVHAAQLYDGLVASAASPRQVRYLHYQKARLAEEQQDYPRAVEAYTALWESDPRDEYGSDGMYRLAQIRIDAFADASGSLRLLDELVCQSPDSVAAGKALSDILREYRRHNRQEEAIVYLQSRYTLLEGSELGDNLAYRRALLLVEVDRLSEAEQVLATFEEAHYTSGLRDDAWWHLAQVHLKAGDLDKGLRVLKNIADERDSSWVVGSYDSHYVDDARYLRALLLLDRVKDYDAAYDEFAQFLTEFPESILRDEARWNMVQAHLAAGQGEDAMEECGTLAATEPESRWVKHCHVLTKALAEGATPTSLRVEGAD